MLRPGSVDDVAAMVRWANRHDDKVAPQGQRHSVYGRAQTDGGIVIDMSQRRSIHSVDADRVIVDAGATWRDVLAATLPQRLTPPVLANYLDLSVGGTLVIGGVGDTTSRYGMQSDNVLELEVVTGEGRRVRCSPRRNADLFDAVRAGLGQVAVITTATLRLVPAPERVRRYVLTYPDLRTLLNDQRLVIADDRFDGLQGAVLPTPAGWQFQLDAVAHGSAEMSRRTTMPCSPDCPTTGRPPRSPTCPTSTTSTGWRRWSRHCAPTASGSIRIRGSPPSSATPRSRPWSPMSWPD